MRSRPRFNPRPATVTARSPRPALSAGALLGSLALAQCAEPPTRILVVVDSNLRMPAEYDRVLARACRDNSPAGTPVADVTCAEDRAFVPLRLDAARPLPLSFAVTQDPGVADDTPVLIEVTAALGDTQQVLRRARVRFEQRQVTVLSMYLDRYCTLVDCAPNTVCTQVQPQCTQEIGRLPPIGTVTPGQEFDVAVFDAIVPDEGASGPDAGPIDADPIDASTMEVSTIDATDAREAGADAVTPPSDGTPPSDARPEGGDVVAPDDGVERCSDTCTPCAFLQRDPNNCGRCGNRCPGAPNALPTCSAGVCTVTCARGFADCSPGPDGCETNLGNTTVRCGACGTVCSTAPILPHGQAYCDPAPTRPVCGLECDRGYGNDEGVGDTCVPVPRPIGPPSGSVLTTNTPTLRWENPAGATGLVLAICNGAGRCSDTVFPTGTTYRPTTPFAPGAYSWSVGMRLASSVQRSPWWTFHVPARVITPPVIDPPIAGVRFDMNGDGRTDVLIGSSNAGDSEMFPTVSPDRVYGYRGSMERATQPEPDATLTAPVATSGFGASVVAAGDLNGDGYGDAAVRSYGNELFVINGRPGALPTTYSYQVSLPPAAGAPRMAPAGDLDGDGYSDLVVSVEELRAVRVYLGGAHGLSSARFIALNGLSDGWDVSALVGNFDANGDGRPDIAVSNQTTPRVLVWVSSTGSVGAGTVPLALTVMTPTESGLFGEVRSLAAGDLNGDGFAELVAGVPHGGADGAGRVAVWSGARSMPYSRDPIMLVPTSLGTADDTRFGWQVSAAGDLDGDNLPDVLVSAVGARALVAYSRLDAANTTPLAIERRDATGPEFGIEFATVVGLDATSVTTVLVSEGYGQPVDLLRATGSSSRMFMRVAEWPAPTVDGRAALNFGESITR